MSEATTFAPHPINPSSPAQAAPRGTPLHLQSTEFAALLDTIRAGAAARDRDRLLPFDTIALIRQARLGDYPLNQKAPPNLGFF